MYTASRASRLRHGFLDLPAGPSKRAFSASAAVQVIRPPEPFAMTLPRRLGTNVAPQKVFPLPIWAQNRLKYLDHLAEDRRSLVDKWNEIDRWGLKSARKNEWFNRSPGKDKTGTLAVSSAFDQVSNAQLDEELRQAEAAVGGAYREGMGAGRDARDQRDRADRDGRPDRGDSGRSSYGGRRDSYGARQSDFSARGSSRTGHNERRAQDDGDGSNQRGHDEYRRDTGRDLSELRPPLMRRSEDTSDLLQRSDANGSSNVIRGDVQPRQTDAAPEREKRRLNLDERRSLYRQESRDQVERSRLRDAPVRSGPPARRRYSTFASRFGAVRRFSSAVPSAPTSSSPTPAMPGELLETYDVGAAARPKRSKRPINRALGGSSERATPRAFIPRLPHDPRQMTAQQLVQAERAKQPKMYRSSIDDEWNPQGQRWSPRKKLTVGAMEELRTLYRIDPTTYNKNVLADKFKISFEAVGRILHNGWRLKEEAQAGSLAKMAEPMPARRHQASEAKERDISGTKWATPDGSRSRV